MKFAMPASNHLFEKVENLQHIEQQAQYAHAQILELIHQDLQISDIPWHRLSTAYGRATEFPQYFASLEHMQSFSKCKTALQKIAQEIEHQGTIWHATPLAVLFLGKILFKAYQKLATVPGHTVAYLVASNITSLFATLESSFYDVERFNLTPQPLPYFTDMLKEEYLWSEIFDEEEDELRYEEAGLEGKDVFEPELFFSFYTYSHQLIQIYLRNLHANL